MDYVINIHMALGRNRFPSLLKSRAHPEDQEGDMCPQELTCRARGRIRTIILGLAIPQPEGRICNA